jgi:hypothetical protein
VASDCCGKKEAGVNPASFFLLFFGLHGKLLYSYTNYPVNTENKMKKQKERKMVAFSDSELHKTINLIAGIKGVTAQEVIREGINMYLGKLEKDQAEFIKRMAKI